MASIVTPAVPKGKTPLVKIILPRLVRLALLVAIDAFVVWFIIKLVGLGYLPLVAAFAIITLVVNVVVLRKEAYPIRWMVVGLVLMALFTIYPIIFTVWVSFTNYGESHLITKQQALDQFLKQKYLPEKGMSYTWTAYKTAEGAYALWLVDSEGKSYLAKPGELISNPVSGEGGIGELDSKGIPKQSKVTKG